MVTLAVPGQGTCSPWATAADVCDPCDDYTMNAILLDNALQAASDILYALSGRQWAGTCTDKVRPCARSIAPDHGRPLRVGGGFYPGPYIGGGFSPWGWCSCNRTERAGFSVPEITLGGYPVTGITQVKIDGAVVDPATYQVDDYRYLVRLADPVTGINPAWPCFPAGTRVLTARGSVPIEDVVVGDRVLTHQGRWRRVTRSGQTGVSELVLLRGQGGVIRCTPDHQFWSAEVSTGGYVKNGRHPWKLGAPEWTDAAQLVGRTWATPRSFAPLPLELPEGWSIDDLPPNFWWVVGRWVGDGWTSPRPPNGKRGGGNNRVLICAGHHEADRLAEELDRTGWKWRRNEQRTTARFSTLSGPLRAWLLAHFGSGVASKTIPAWLLAADESVRSEFLAGLVSADGWRSCRPGAGAVSFTSYFTISRDLAVGVKMLAASLGYGPSLYEGNPSPTTTIEGRIVNVRPTYRVDWSHRPAGSPYSQTWVDDLHVWGRVKGAELLEGPVPVFDIEVEQDHSFVADGFVVHNCHQRLDLASDQPDTFEVTYTYGVAPPQAGVNAAAYLGCQLALACDPDTISRCQLPQRVTNIARQGVSMVVLDPMSFIDKGRTGIYLVDLFLEAANPGRLTRPSVVMSPDIGRRVRRSHTNL